jgi:hypothetical protein
LNMRKSPKFKMEVIGAKNAATRKNATDKSFNTTKLN